MNRIKIHILFLIFFIPFNSLFADLTDGKIALLYSGYTEKMTTENPLWIKDQLTMWELYLIEQNFDYAVIDDETLENGLGDDYSVLLLPLARSMSSSEIQEVKNFLMKGKSVFATWSFASYDENGQWRGWEELEKIFGVGFKNEISRDEVSRIHSIKGDSPLSINIPAGFRLQATTYDSPIEAVVTAPSAHALGYWYNEDNPFAGKADYEKTTSIVYGNYNIGKFVWMGFDLTAVVGSKIHQNVFKNLLKNIIYWLYNEPLVWARTWPQGKDAAAVLSCDVEFQFEKINNALDIFEEKNIAGQFFILTDVIEEKSLQRILQFGDIGLHGDNHDVFQWQSYGQQYERLKSAREKLENLTGKNIHSFRPPETAYDNSTVKALKELNYGMLAADFIGDRGVPQYLSDNLIIMPQTGYDDYDLIIRMKIKSAREQADKYLLDFNRNLFEGALYILYYHTQLQCLNDNIEALGIVIDELKSKNVWITSAYKVEEWWRKKEKLKVSFQKNSEQQYSIMVKNNGSESISNVVISFNKDDFLTRPDLTAREGNKILEHDFDYAANIININLDEIKSGEEKKIILTAENFQ